MRQEKSQRKQKSVKLHMRQMQVITFVSAILIAVIFSFLTLWQNHQYGKIISNLTMATEFNFDFKANIDYKMYRIVIGADTFESLNPYEDLENSRQVFRQLRDSTEYEKSQKGLDGLLVLVNLLEMRIHDIEESTIFGNYDSNIKRLDNDIYIITDLIEEKMSEYIYNETKTLEALRHDLEQQMKGFIAGSMGIGICLFMFLLKAFSVLSKKITEPIEALCEHTKQFADGKMEVHAPESDVMELQLLSNQYEYMACQIKELIVHIKEEQENLRQTELQLLQSQINPHFLYNTLDAIMWLAERKQYKKVVEMITSLSMFLRIGLSKGRDYIQIREEVDHVRNYLQIQHYRYEDILDYQIDVEEQIMGSFIPKLSLQPIVENALYHGIKNKRGKGMLSLQGWLEDDKAVIQVKDNGIGISEEKLHKLRQELMAETM